MKKVIFSLVIILILPAYGDSFFQRPSTGIPLLGTEQAIKNLQQQMAAEKSQTAQAKMAFAIGVFFFKMENKAQSEEYFKKSLELGTRLGDYSEFFLGLLSLDKKNLPEAAKHFRAVVQYNPPSTRKVEAQLQLARIAQSEERWGEALELLRGLQRKYRGDPQHPDILFSLYTAAHTKKLNGEACQVANIIYGRYPVYGLSKGWNEDLSSIGCSPRIAEQEKRFSQLMQVGEFEQCRKEIKIWSEKTRKDGKPHPQEMGFYESQLGRINLAEGKVKEAIFHFNAAQDMMGRNLKTQMLLARAYSQTDDYAAAVEGYVKAYNLGPGSKLGQLSLFQAAFLSYQNLDYDGASRRFEELARRGRGRVVWDSKWHLAWIRYLKEDYDGAMKAFTELSTRKKIETVDLEKLMYWRAMSLLRLGSTEEARQIFTDLSTRKRMGYYTGAALARLASLPSEKKGPSISAPPGSAPAPEVKPLADSRKPASEDDNVLPKAEDEGTAAPEAEPLPPETSDVPVTTWKDPALALRFERAKDLIELGFDLWARAELREIEKRTRNQSYLQLLMSEYAKVNEFNRSAYIGDVTFSAQREKTGIDGAPQLWTFAFPQAYSKPVIKYSKKYDVSPSLVWSVMRGESAFKEDTHSGAGALGLMQMIPPTGKKIAQRLKMDDFKKEILLDPETNIGFGTWYLNRLTKSMDQQIPLAIASYNAGPHRVLGWLLQFGRLDMDEFVEHIPYMETRNYVKKVLRNYFVYQTLYEKKPNPIAWISRKVSMKYSGPKPVAENWDD